MVSASQPSPSASLQANRPLEVWVSSAVNGVETFRRPPEPERAYIGRSLRLSVLDTEHEPMLGQIGFCPPDCYLAL